MAAVAHKWVSLQYCNIIMCQHRYCLYMFLKHVCLLWCCESAAMEEPRRYRKAKCLHCQGNPYSRLPRGITRRCSYDKNKAVLNQTVIQLLQSGHQTSQNSGRYWMLPLGSPGIFIFNPKYKQTWTNQCSQFLVFVYLLILVISYHPDCDYFWGLFFHIDSWL